VKVVAETLGVARSNLIDRLNNRTKPRRRYYKAQDAALALLITTLVAARPTYGYRRITAILNRQLRSEGLAPVNSAGSATLVSPYNFAECLWMRVPLVVRRWVLRRLHSAIYSQMPRIERMGSPELE